MGRAILPELAAALLILALCGAVLVAIGAAQRAAGLAITQRVKERRQRRATEREQVARRDARWEAHTYYQGGLAVITTRRVARWDGKEAVVATEDSNVILPEVDTEGITRAQIDAGLRAQHRNMQQRHGGDL